MCLGSVWSLRRFQLIYWGDVACFTEVVRLRVHVAFGLQMLGIGGGCDLLLALLAAVGGRRVISQWMCKDDKV